MDAKKFNLGDLLRKIKSGEVQLPDFQREWIWDDEKIKSLLESVIRGFPINSILLLECNPADMKFSSRPIAGVDAVDCRPQQLILDGQQRLTSLFGALFSDKPVKFQKGKDKFYYVDMKKAIDAVKNFETVDDMIVSVNDSKKLKAKGINWDLSTPEKEFAADMFPLNKIFGDTLNWIFGYTNYHANDEAKKILATEFNSLVQKIVRYEIVEVILERDTALESVCKIFENVNRGGERLGVFDLLTAIFAMHVDENGKPIELGKDWEKVRDVFKDSDLNILEAVDKSDFITAVTLLVSYRNRKPGKPVRCKSEDILDLKCSDYLKYRDAVAEGFVEAAKFLAEDDNKVTTKKYLPYAPQLIPMSAIFTELKLSGKLNAASRKKIRQWYWCGVFGESYKDGHLARFAKDIVQVMRWIDVNREFPEILRKTQIGALRLMSVKKLQSAAYKGMFAIIFQNGAKDFLEGRNMGSSANFAESIDAHHIFPKKYCDAKKIPKERCDNIANKTPLLSNTNKLIGSDPPSIYLSRIEGKTKLPGTDVDDFLESHFANAELCRADNFDAFIVDRAKKILDAVEKITDREVVGRDSPEIKKIFGALLI